MARDPRVCDFCSGPVGEADLETGRAIILLGRTYCPRCIDEEIRKGRTESPRRPAPVTPGPSPSSRVPRGDSYGDTLPKSPPTESEAAPESGPDPERRGDDRYVPPSGCELALRRRGLWGLLHGNVVCHWLEIAPGGLRAVVSRKVRRGDVLEARISIKLRRQSFAARVVAHHVSESHKYPGSFVAGFRFVDPSDELRACIREELCRFPAAPGGVSHALPDALAGNPKSPSPEPGRGNGHG
jgi:hypothetical protein